MPCEHLENLDPDSLPAPRTPDACQDCLDEGTGWVALRGCLTCGHVGCCDSSVGRHATRHHETSGHPTMQSLSSDDPWTWCYVHRVYGLLKTAAPAGARS